MKILAIENEIHKSDKQQFLPYLKEEALKVWELQQANIIREIYFTLDDHCAVIILECGNAAEANDILNTLPLVKANLISFDVKTLVPYDGLSRLLKGD